MRRTGGNRDRSRFERGWTETDRGQVAELQGLYGPFSFPEKLLQKIWLRGDFAHQACFTTDGRKLEVLFPGRWNLLGGPDFKHARLRLGGIEVRGDVELHLHARDWAAHRHAMDPAYDQVVLHVVLFPPEAGQLTAGASLRVIPELILLPLLHHDLEEYAADEAVEMFANRPMSQALEELGPMEGSGLKSLLVRGALRRWKLKTHFTRLRLHRLGWEAACHHAALEILGYRFNRAAMLRVATRLPLKDWRSTQECGGAALASEEGNWTRHGVRPANHPAGRLQQYARWVKARPDWPQRLEQVASTLPRGKVGTGDVGSFRRTHRLAALRDELRDFVCHGEIGGSRFDNLVCDGFLPLLAVRVSGSFEELWFHWFPGDLPPEVLRTLRLLEVIGRRSDPAHHGAGQGLLNWLIERENAAVGPSRERAGRGA